VGLSNPLRSSARQSASLAETANRPWPLPARDWRLAQTLEDVLFCHWRVPGSALRAVVPPALELDRYRGETWLGIVALRFANLRLRGTLPVPFLSRFLGLNVRTYVRVGEKPGIFFLGLDAASQIAAAAAQRIYRLPYFQARISHERNSWASLRVDPGAHSRSFRARYSVSGGVARPAPGTLEHFLIERFCLYAVEGRRVQRVDIHHRSWRVQPADVVVEENTMPPAPIELRDETPLAHYSERQDILIWPPEPLG
jgi:uncharacterized protein YqjF (DUF2071 family)